MPARYSASGVCVPVGFGLLRALTPVALRSLRFIGASIGLSGRDERFPVASHPVEHLAIVALRALPEQPRGRIPGTILAIEQPAMVGRVGQQDPGRTPERRR